MDEDVLTARRAAGCGDACTAAQPVAARIKSPFLETTVDSIAGDLVGSSSSHGVYGKQLGRHVATAEVGRFLGPSGTWRWTRSLDSV